MAKAKSLTNCELGSGARGCKTQEVGEVGYWMWCPQIVQDIVTSSGHGEYVSTEMHVITILRVHTLDNNGQHVCRLVDHCVASYSTGAWTGFSPSSFFSNQAMSLHVLPCLSMSLHGSPCFSGCLSCWYQAKKCTLATPSGRSCASLDLILTTQCATNVLISCLVNQSV